MKPVCKGIPERFDKKSLSSPHCPPAAVSVVMESSSVASASSEAGSTRSQEIEELERFIDSYVLEYQVQGLLGDKGDGDLDLDDGGKVPQWTDNCNDYKDDSWTSSQGRNSSKPDEWEHSSNGSSSSRPSSGSRPGSGSRSGSRGRNNQFKGSTKNGNKDVAFDILGTDIWAANTMDSRGGTGWDVQPEKLDFSHFHRKHTRAMPKHLPHIDREGMSKNKFEEDDGLDLTDIEKFLPHLCSVFPPLPNEAEIAHTKKLFRRKRNDRRRQQRAQGGSKNQSPSPQHHWDQQSPSPTEAGDNRNNGRSPRQYQGGHGQRQGGTPHGYNQNRRWHPNQKGPGQQNPAGTDRGLPLRGTKETENVKVTSDKHTRQMEVPRDCESPADFPKAESALDTNALSDVTAGKESPGWPGRGQSREPPISLLQSSKERLQRRLKDKEEALAEVLGTPSMDRLLRLLNSMRSNSSGVEEQLASFMVEAQSSARSEESLTQVVGTIYDKGVSDRSFAATAAKLCDKMALFMVDGTKFRSLLLNLLQKDFVRREELQRSDVEVWLGFITFLCEVFGTMRSSSWEPFRVLVCPIYTCLRELLQSKDVKEDAVLCFSMELQSVGRLLEEQLPEMMTELLAAVRDKMLSPAESPLSRSLLMEVVELHAHRWSPLEALTTQYYNRTIHKLTT
ncbi:CBP80/20-dependent translation initiation factor isoform X1 [Syngnathus typhle]|uniref:CBP80/20-dependent translation initiation factor isoform X1 n=2 Tax=Syngnathus typhle TaxID=161592 RepID=UPI002A69D982|nr:CBP80/20-dependent translation initiation factor isoform X1 [Syngnathus typhle]XP_061149359.1 CBP80/20-dependent translation initiation factor isoform X1 [Syngnathus typhle]